ncbi:BrnT family toxin [Methylobacterium sp. J-048]|uniref:BrnT family toxin n=1 Tax=Methylobacterium sp. J-048 TaxID=2836635 RepID=UPI001FBA093C|nr:BrnT family toxin [Methylobacterium sp. J-048]MCJ2055077.1 BrnT family toxin [Methylobacterium sp. J-048]
MRVVWDEPKRVSNLAKHGLDFADARDRLRFEDSVVVPSHPGPDGRRRFVAIGLLDGRLVTAVLAPLGSEALALVSLRPASRKERRIYEDA